VGDGATDDVVALQEVLDAVGASGGGIVAVLKHHAISRSLLVWSNTSIIGTGKISAAANFTGTLAGDSCYLIRNKNWAATQLTDRRITVNGPEFDYRATVIVGGGAHAISMRRVFDVTVANSVFRNGEDATAFLGCENTLVDNCKAYDFINCAYDHWASPSKKAVVRDCYAETSNSVQMVNFNPDNTFGSSAGTKAAGFSLTGTTLKYNGAGAAPCQLEPLSAGCEVSSIHITGNTFDNTYLVARGHTGKVIVSDNEFSNITGGKNAILVQEAFNARPYYVGVHNNIITGVTTPAASGGVITLKANTYSCTGNVVDAPNAYVALFAADGDGTESGNRFSVGTSKVKQIGVNYR
jgi:hypothetical protein